MHNTPLYLAHRQHEMRSRNITARAQQNAAGLLDDTLGTLTRQLNTDYTPEIRDAVIIETFEIALTEVRRVLGAPNDNF